MVNSFLTQFNLYGSKGISDSHDTATFLMLYNSTVVRGFYVEKNGRKLILDVLLGTGTLPS